MELKDILKKLKSAESTLSTILGILVVVVAVVFMFNYFKGLANKQKQNGETSSISIEEQKNEQNENALTAENGNTYLVKKGDNLWKISENTYGTGYNWIDIAKENNLKNPNLIVEGQKLIIPKVEPKTNVEIKKLSIEKISEDKYTVQKGDNLWKISVRAYQDGFQWPKIAKANNLVNPSLIHPGNVLEIPR